MDKVEDKELPFYNLKFIEGNNDYGVTSISFDCDNLDKIITEQINNPEIRILTINKDGKA